MGALLTVQTALKCTVQTAAERGVKYCISFAICYIYLLVRKYIYGRRFDLYDYKDNDPEKAAFFIPQEEWKLDTRREDGEHLDLETDDAFCFGVNSNSDALAIHIARLADSRVRCSLFLKLADERTFTLPEEHLYRCESREEYTFGCSRLKLQCLRPMRKWRIFFNGILREVLDNENDLPKYQHVTFTFIITASSGVFDFTTDFSKSLLSHSFASLEEKDPSAFFHRLIKKIFNCYEQPSMILGTYTVGKEDEKEMYLWGIRGRYMVERDLSGSIQEIYGNFQDGSILHLVLLKLPISHLRFAYGYLMISNGKLFPIDNLVDIPADSSQICLKFQFLSDCMNYNLEVKETVSVGVKFLKEHGGDTVINLAKMLLNNKPGQGFVLNGTLYGSQECKKKSVIIKDFFDLDVPLTVTFDQVLCQNSDVTGGKGSSLARLSAISKELKPLLSTVLFEVPKGIVVTTEAYKKFTKGSLGESLKQFQKTVWSSSEQQGEEHFQKIVDEVSNAHLSEEIEKSIEVSLNAVFGDRVGGTKFAVRSSAIGEDTEQMSSAGQMQTFLGLKDRKQVLKAVKNCWASQFSKQAVEYKRRYGQLINTPMAVVIQEMVPCEVAGVAFTCDPVSGNPEFISLTANWGLGESVVSASSDPDTVIIQRAMNNSVKFYSQQIGEKQVKVIMDEKGGTKEIYQTEGSSECCLSEEMSLQLGKIAVKVEEIYGAPQDIEWGITSNTIFLFQARPITSLDQDTDFEAKHMFDNYMRCEKEYYSKANVGEVMPGASTPLSIDFLQKMSEVSTKRHSFIRNEFIFPDVPYIQKGIVSAYNHVFFGLIDTFPRVEDEFNDITKIFMIGLFGRPIEDPVLARLSVERHKAFMQKNGTLFPPFLLYWMMFVSGMRVKRALKKLEMYKVSVKPQNSAFQILNQIAKEYFICEQARSRHMECTISSSMWNMFVLMFLAKKHGGWTNDVYTDFAFLLSSCSGVLSAEIPAALEKLGITIAKCIDIEKFKNMTDEEAYNWLQNSICEASHQFKGFLAKHGHRCLKEFDVYSKTWEDNPLPLVKMLKDLVGTKSTETAGKSSSFSYIISKLGVQLSFMSRFIFRLLLPNCRRGVRERELSKNTYILAIDKLRKPFYMLAEAMVREGYFPHREMLFFLSIDEIVQLMKTRSPRLVTRALKRWKCHKELDELFFPEIMSGIPKPVNLSAGIQDAELSDGLTMHGVPVSPGVVKGTARVVIQLSEASNIQPGDILITYSTDVGWTPYFPLLSGVVTELGGLISHGAVVAREYGLPCVVALHGATRVFKSGNTVILDGNKGFLKCIED